MNTFVMTYQRDIIDVYWKFSVFLFCYVNLFLLHNNVLVNLFLLIFNINVPKNFYFIQVSVKSPLLIYSKEYSELQILLYVN